MANHHTNSNCYLLCPFGLCFFSGDGVFRLTLFPCGGVIPGGGFWLSFLVHVFFLVMVLSGGVVTFLGCNFPWGWFLGYLG